MAMVEARDIRKAFGRKKVLSGVSFFIEKGQCVGIAGANGCGKSTLLSVMAGAVRPDGGQILYDGKPAGRQAIYSITGYVPQGNPLLPELSVKDNLRLWFKGRTKEWKASADSGIVPMLGLDTVWKTAAGKLSGGMKRRLTLACALISHPRFLILDEPANGLDPLGIRALRGLLAGLAEEEGMTILLSSHILSKLEKTAGRIGILEEGRLLEEFSPKEAQERFPGGLEELFIRVTERREKL